MRSTILCSLLAALCLIPTACGDDDGAESTDASADKALSAEAYRDEMNGLCRRSQAEAKDVSRPKSADDIDEYLDESADLLRKYQREAASLNPPSSLEADHRESLEAGRQLIALFDRTADRARSSDEPAKVLLAASPRVTVYVEKGNASARKLGLKDCARGSAATTS
jgi:hypothetical protein